MSASNENRHGLRRPYAQISGRASSLPDERIVRRDRVRRVGARRRVDAQDLPEQCAQGLAVPSAGVAGTLVVRSAAVAERDIEVAVGSERELSTVVIGLRLIDDQQVPTRRRCRRPRRSSRTRRCACHRTCPCSPRRGSCRRARTRARASPAHPPRSCRFGDRAPVRAASFPPRITRTNPDCSATYNDGSPLRAAIAVVPPQPSSTRVSFTADEASTACAPVAARDDRGEQ